MNMSEQIKNHRCICGCDTFKVDCSEQSTWTICVNEDGFIELIDEDSYESDFIGNFICTNCGKEYADIDDIPIT